MRASVITALAALGLASVLFVPMTANATNIGSAGPARAASDDGGWEHVKDFDSQTKCLEEADKQEDEHDTGAICTPEGNRWQLWVQRYKDE
jgi:hypothetical protein